MSCSWASLEAACAGPPASSALWAQNINLPREQALHCTWLYTVLVHGSWKFKRYLRFFGLCLVFAPFTPFIRLGGLASCLALLGFFPIFSKNYYRKRKLLMFTLDSVWHSWESAAPSFLAWYPSLPANILSDDFGFLRQSFRGKTSPLNAASSPFCP